MKKRCILLSIVMVLTCFSACSNQPKAPLPIEVPPPVEQTNTDLKLFYTSLYHCPSTILDAAVAEYNRQYPEQPVEVEKYITDDLVAYQEEYLRIITQLMAGDGPDILLLDTLTMGVEKMARSGVFADMEPYFQADNYDWSDFNQVVMDGGVWEGKRLVIPLFYTIPILYTSVDALEETGFSLENCQNFQGFLQEAERIQLDDQKRRSVFRKLGTCARLPYYGKIPYIDYSQQSVDLTFPELRQCAEIYKRLRDAELPNDTDELDGAADIRDGKALWISPSFALDGFIIGGGAIKTFSDLVMLPIRDKDGGIQAEITQSVAVRNNSGNLQNAYNFLKILLSEELGQATIGVRWQEFSVQDSLNNAYYQFDVTDRQNAYIVPGTCGFEEIIPPTTEEFAELMGYTQAVTGAYFPNSLRDGFLNLMTDYLHGAVSYEKALKQAQKQLEIYLSE